MASHLARFHPDGTLDTNFLGIVDPIPWFSDVWTVSVQNDGKILVGGDFQSLNGQPRSYLGRFHADGTLDTDFNPGANAPVESFLVQADGKILVCGGFTMLGGQARSYLGRLHPDGQLDTEFNPGPDAEVAAMAEQPDGKILVGGNFNHIAGQWHYCIGRLHPNGTVDMEFDTWAGSSVTAIALQPDGRILISGSFRVVDSVIFDEIARLYADGTVDITFNPKADGNANSIVVQADGRILVGGWFTELCGQRRNYLARFHADGTLDQEFNPGADYVIGALAIQADGKILAAGGFKMIGGQSRKNFARLHNTALPTESLSYDGSTITWHRGGTSPEVWQTTFDHSTDRQSWVRLGEGTRIPGLVPGSPGGWELTGISLPLAGTIRAQARVSGGSGNGNCWFVESYLGAPNPVMQPISRTNNAGTTATFYYGFDLGIQPLSYQWFKDGLPLADGGKVSGTATSTLRLNQVLRIDEGEYHVQVGTTGGDITSAAATLTVVDPCIIGQPQSQEMDRGQTTTLSVAAAGTEPISFQWLKDGVTLADATEAILTFSNLQGMHAGNYTVVVSNPHGSVTSAVARLDVNLATLDLTFNPGAAGAVYSLAVQTDQKILMGGSFGDASGQPINSLVRLHADGTLDADFNPAVLGSVRTVAVQTDGKIVVGGYITSVGGLVRNWIARLNADGTVDTAFNPGADNSVTSLMLQEDGRILVSGWFTTLGGAARSRIARLNNDGTLDSTFTPSADGFVQSLALQSDGKILLWGNFTSVNGEARYRIARIHRDGSLDTGFARATNAFADVLAIQPDGKILLAGRNIAWDNSPQIAITRLHADGSFDDSFNAIIDEFEWRADIRSLVLQADGKILVGGFFRTLNGKTNSYIARLHADGSLDSGFRPSSDFIVDALAVQADGSIVVGGEFASFEGHPRAGIARLNSSGPAIQHLAYDGATITWIREGTSPEVGRVTFDYSTNGFDWNFLGSGTRTFAPLNAGQATGWELTGVTVPMTSTLRARGFVTGGQVNGSGWFLEMIGSSMNPRILVHDGGFGFRLSQFGFNLQANVGTRVVVEASSNLEHWLPLATNELTSEAWRFEDPQATNWPRRFYRLKAE